MKITREPHLTLVATGVIGTNPITGWTIQEKSERKGDRGLRALPDLLQKFKDLPVKITIEEITDPNAGLVAPPVPGA